MIRNFISRFDDWIAIRANQIFSTMGFFWVCLIFALLPLKWPAAMPFVQYASSGVLQLVALPLIGVGTILAARASDEQRRQDHEALMVVVAYIRDRHNALHDKLDGALPGQDDNSIA